jgi:hypothetical protein
MDTMLLITRDMVKQSPIPMCLREIRDGLVTRINSSDVGLI